MVYGMTMAGRGTFRSGEISPDPTKVVGQESVFVAEEALPVPEIANQIEGECSGSRYALTKGGTEVCILTLKQGQDTDMEVRLYGMLAQAAEVADHRLRRSQIRAEVTAAPNGKLIASNVWVNGSILSTASILHSKQAFALARKEQEDRDKRARGE